MSSGHKCSISPWSALVLVIKAHIKFCMEAPDIHTFLHHHVMHSSHCVGVRNNLLENLLRGSKVSENMIIKEVECYLGELYDDVFSCSHTSAACRQHQRYLSTQEAPLLQTTLGLHFLRQVRSPRYFPSGS